MNSTLTSQTKWTKIPTVSVHWLHIQWPSAVVCTLVVRRSTLRSTRLQAVDRRTHHAFVRTYMLGPSLGGHVRDLERFSRQCRALLNRITYSNSDLKRQTQNIAMMPNHLTKCSPNTTTLFAAVRFRPVPPASVEMRKTKMSGSFWNFSITAPPVSFVRSSSRKQKLITHDRAAELSRPISQTHNLHTSISNKHPNDLRALTVIVEMKF